MIDHISLSSLLRMRYVSYRSCRINQRINFITNNNFSENRALYEIIWKNTVCLGRPQMTIWCMRIARWISKAPDTHSEYVILTAFFGNCGDTKALQCYVIRTLPVLYENSRNSIQEFTCQTSGMAILEFRKGAQ